MTPQRFPFLVGCARSGTTLLRAMLDAHPEVAVPGESYFPLWFGRQRARYERPDGVDVEAFLADLTAHSWFRHWNLSDQAVRRALAEKPPADFPAAVRVVYGAYAHHHGKRYYADKTPVFVLHIPTLAQLFPEAVFVHIVRDGRDVALSLLDVGWGPSRFGQAALHWRSRVEAGWRAARCLRPERYHEISYEALVRDPEGVARQLLAFLGLPFDHSMLRYFERAQSLITALPDPEDHRNLSRPPALLRNWREQLAPEQVALFEALAGDTLERAGYETSGQRPPRDTRWQALATKTRWAGTRQYDRVRSTAARTFARG